MKPHTIECTTCGGTGKAPLGRELSDTLNCMGDAWISTKDIGVRVAMRTGTVGASTLINRLLKLLDLGFVERRDSVEGAGYEWRKES
jgi:hypothetical protein